MKKVCVVTWTGGTNYGTNLQAYALVEALRKMGYNPSLCGDIKRNLNPVTHIGFYIDKIITRVKNRLKTSTVTNRKTYLHTDSVDIKKARFNRVIDDIPRLNSSGIKEWKTICSEYEAFIAGSDQIWNPNYFKPSMMLNFIEKGTCKKISYSSSIGVSSLPVKSKIIYRQLLASFDAVSVREEDAAKMLESICNRHVEVVADPTMLLDIDDWNRFIDGVDQKELNGGEEPYILCYFVGERKEYWNYVDKARASTRKKVLVVPLDQENTDYDYIENAGPKEFVWLIKNADIVITDSFHATVFSVLFHKDFYVLPRFDENNLQSQNIRLIELLERHGLSERWIVDTCSFERKDRGNFDKSDDVLKQRKSHGMSFLKSAIDSD